LRVILNVLWLLLAGWLLALSYLIAAFLNEMGRGGG